MNSYLENCQNIVQIKKLKKQIAEMQAIIDENRKRLKTLLEIIFSLYYTHKISNKRLSTFLL